MTQSKNRSEILAFLRSMKAGVQKAITDGFPADDNLSKLHLIKTASEGRLLTDLRKYWQLQYNCPLPDDDQLLLESREVKEFFLSSEKTPRQR